MDVLVFRLGSKELFGIEVMSVKEIMPIGQLNHMPGAAHGVAGCMNDRGRAVPVIKLGEVLFSGRGTGEHRLGIILDRQEPYAFAVSNVERITKLTQEQVESLKGYSQKGLLDGVIKDESGLIQILNPNRVISRVIAA